MFFKNKQDSYILTNGDPANILFKLPTDIYKAEMVYENNQWVTQLSKHIIPKNMHRLDTGKFKSITDSIVEFNDPSMYAAREILGNLHKISILMHGEQGCGKTAHAMLLAKMLIQEKNAIGLVVSEHNRMDISDLVAGVQFSNPDQLIVLILDEFEKAFVRGNVPVSMLSFLDGPASKNNLIILATCNDISALPNLLLDRPGRFERIVELEGKSDAVLRATLESLFPFEYKDRLDIESMMEVLKKANKWTIDYARIVVRNAIAELINYDATGIFKQYPIIFPENNKEGEDGEIAPSCFNTGTCVDHEECSECKLLDDCDSNCTCCTKED